MSVVSIVLVVILLLMLGVLGLLLWRFNQISKRVQGIEKSMSEGEGQAFLPHLKLTIHDPHLIAQKESKLAKAVGAVSPEYIRYRVYKQVAAELELALTEREINVSIEMVGLKGNGSKTTKGSFDSTSKA